MRGHDPKPKVLSPSVWMALQSQSGINWVYGDPLQATSSPLVETTKVFPQTISLHRLWRFRAPILHHSLIWITVPIAYGLPMWLSYIRSRLQHLVLTICKHLSIVIKRQWLWSLLSIICSHSQEGVPKILTSLLLLTSAIHPSSHPSKQFPQLKLNQAYLSTYLLFIQIK